MTSPNVQIQNLMRRYVRERDGTVASSGSLHEMVKSLTSSPKEPIELSNRTQICLTLPGLLQTNLLYNFKPSFEYYLDEFKCAITQDESPPSNDNMFEMDEENSSVIADDELPTLLYGDMELVRRSNYREYIGNGIWHNIYGAELVDEKWMLYCFIVSKIYKSFKTNMLNDNLKVHSLHIGYDCGSTQTALNHLFTASEPFDGISVQWQWATLSRNNDLYGMHNKQYNNHFVPLLTTRPYWEQAVFVINKAAEISDRYNLIIYQINDLTDIAPTKMRQQYLFTIIMALRFLDSQGVLLMELPHEKQWGLLEVNILALCGLIFDAVYFTKYEIGRDYCILICRDKKKNLATSAIVKKLIKILCESTTLCIVDRQALGEEWLTHIRCLYNLPLVPIGFIQIVEELKNTLHYCEHPLT